MLPARARCRKCDWAGFLDSIPPDGKCPTCGVEDEFERACSAITCREPGRYAIRHPSMGGDVFCCEKHFDKIVGMLKEVVDG